MKQSELLRKQADMIDMAEKYGIDDWRKLVQFDHNDRWHRMEGNALTMHTTWSYRFALGVVEGKPVFEGDELFGVSDFKINQRKVTASHQEGGYVVMQDGGEFLPQHLSWNPPKPKTVTVELLREDAEWMLTAYNSPTSSIAKACRKALEEQK